MVWHRHSCLCCGTMQCRILPTRFNARHRLHSTPMLLALFLIDLAAGLYLFLPFVGRRNAGVKFYRLILITSGALALGAQLAHIQRWQPFEMTAVVLTIIVYITLRFPKR